MRKLLNPKPSLNPKPCFNVAASIKMRKSEKRGDTVLGIQKLQCGRIYKDAEINSSLRSSNLEVKSFNVAASIKMRKSPPPRPCRSIEPRFNVAASIKMRKSSSATPTRKRLFWLQCGRIYKDAEIYHPSYDAPEGEIASMWPHL